MDFPRTIWVLLSIYTLFFANPLQAAAEAQYRYSHINNLNDLGRFMLGYGVGFYEGGVGLVEGVATLATLSFKFSRAGYLYETTVGQNYRQELNMVTTTYKAIKPLVEFAWDIRTKQIEAALYAVRGDLEEAVAKLSAATSLQVNFAKEVIIYLEQLDATNTVYDRGRLQGRVAFEVVTILIAEIKLAEVGQLANLSSKLRFLEGLLARCRAASEGSVLAKSTPAVEAAVEAAKGVPVAGQIGQFTRTTTPWSRSVWQRADIDWALRRPDGLTNLEAALANGNVPLRRFGNRFEYCELHHLNQDPFGSVTEVWLSTHRQLPHKLVPPPSWRITHPELLAAWKIERRNYWMWRASQVQP